MLPTASSSRPMTTLASVDTRSWLDLPILVGILAEHFRRVHGLDVCRRQVERSRVVEPHRVFDDEASLGHVAVIGAEALEGSLLECRPDRALFVFALREQRRIAAEPATQHGAAGRNWIVDD